MGGVGQRFGSELPKQFHRLAGKMVYLHTLEAFLATGIFDEIVLSCHPHWVLEVQNSLPSSPCPIRVIPAGANRQESSYLGLQGFTNPPAVVVIHDAVRPFVSQKIILENAKCALETGAVDTCIPSADTLVHAPSRQTIQSVLKRSEYLRGQTPQSFSFELILKAHEKTQLSDCSDDCRLVMDLKHPIRVVDGDESNIKITSELDLFLAEQLLRMRTMEQKAYRFSSLAGRRFIIVGVSGGIGKAIEKKIIAAQGCVIGLSRNTTPISIDLCQKKSIEQAFQAVRQQHGPVDGLINCAGCLTIGSLDQLSFEDIETAIDVNLKGLIYSCKLVSLKKNAHIINIASSSFSRGRKNMCLYSSAKAGVVNFTQGLAEEREDLKIHAVIPQRTNTPMRRKNFPHENELTLLSPENVAETVVGLLCENDLSGLLVEVRKNH